MLYTNLIILQVYPYDDDDEYVDDEEGLLQDVIVNYGGLFSGSSGFFTDLVEYSEERSWTTPAVVEKAREYPASKMLKKVATRKETVEESSGMAICDTSGANQQGGCVISDKHVCDNDSDGKTERIWGSMIRAATTSEDAQNQPDDDDKNDKGPGFGEALMVKPVVDDVEIEIPTVQAFEAVYDLENHPGPSPCMILQVYIFHICFS